MEVFLFRLSQNPPHSRIAIQQTDTEISVLATKWEKNEIGNGNEKQTLKSLFLNSLIKNKAFLITAHNF